MKDMFRFLRELKGNAKTSLVLDPMWCLPFNMYAPFVALYMFSLGLGDFEIGLLLSIGTFANVIMALLSGVVTDKFGRKNTLIIADFVGWNIPVLIWAFAQNFWWFLVAALLNSFSQFGMVAFECTWQDDLEEHKFSRTVSWFHISWHITILFTLISGYLVAQHTVVPVMRGLYLFAFVLMGARLVILQFLLKETNRGKERMEATKDKSIVKLLSGYKEVILQMRKSKGMVQMLILLPMVHIYIMVTSTFFGLYATQNLGIGEYFLAYFPVIRSVITLMFFFFIQTPMYRFKAQHVMGIGLTLYILSHSLLLIAPPQNMIWLIIYAVIDACAASMFLPRFDTQLFSSLDDKERARCRALITVVTLAIASPFGALAGFLANIDRRLPFMLNMIIFVCMIYFVVRTQNKNEPVSH